MTIFITYLLQVAIAQTILLACYWLLLRRDTFYKMNRWYFLGGLGLSFIIPLITIDLQQLFAAKSEVTDGTIVYQYIPNLSFNNISQHWWQYYSAFDYAVGIMMIGTAIMLIKMLVQYLSLKKLNTKQQASFEEYNIQLLEEKVNPFSFGKTIYLNPQLHSEQELEEIIEHELVHIIENHSVDVITALVNRCIFWWNPAAWLLNKAVRDNLEFIADRLILEKGFDRKHYQYHLLRISQLTYSNSIAHHFNFSNLKKRISMMNKKNSHPILQAKWLLLIPVAAVVLLSFNYRNDIIKSVQQASTATDTVPAAPKAPLTGNKKGYQITVTDNNGNCTVLVKDKKGKTKEIVSLTEWNEHKEKYETAYGSIPPPPPPMAPLAPVSPVAPIAPLAPTAPLAPINKNSDASMNFSGVGIKTNSSNKLPSEVLYIVDGEISTQAEVESIDPANIATVDVLKGTNATELYGEKGINGVVKINLKNNINTNADVNTNTASVTIKSSMATATKESMTFTGEPITIKANSSNSPLIYIDGKESNTEMMNALNPNDIESVSIVKDKASIEKYGDKGKHGVIQIKLKPKKIITITSQPIIYTNAFTDWVIKPKKDGC